MAKRESKVTVTAEDKTGKATKSAKQNVTKMERAFKGLKSTAAKLGAAMGVAFSLQALKSYAQESVKLYGQQIQAEQKLAAAIRTTGGNVDDLLPQYKDLASAIQGVTTIGDETTLAMMQQAKSMGVAEDRMEEATKGAIGLSKALGIGTQQAIRGVANAMNNQFTTLQRYIPELRTASTDAEKMAIVQEKMASGFEIAKSEADNGYGAMQQLGNSIGDLQEQTGRAITSAMQPFVESLNTWVTKLTEAKTAANDLMDALRTKNSGEELSLKEQIILQQQQIENIQSRIAADKVNEQVGWGRFKAEKSNTEELEAQLRAAENKLGILQRQQQAQKENNEQEEQQTQRELDIHETAAEKRLEIRKEFAQREFEAQANVFEKIEAERQAVLDEMRAAYVKTGREVQMVNDWFDAQQVRAKEEMIGKMDDISEEWRQREIERIKEEWEAEKAASERKKQLAREEMQKKIDYMMQYSAAFQSVFSSFATIQSNMYQKRIDAAEEGSAEEKKLMREQAKAQRRWARFQAIINTATAVTKTMTSVPYPANVPLAMLQSAAGMAQVAAIRSEPLPAFAAGQDFIANGPQTVVVGEKGRERVRIDPQPDNRMEGVHIHFNAPLYGAGDPEEFAGYLVRLIKQGQRAGRVEAL
ncbi:MAG: hypothetical protein K9L57_10290 [Spirochaetaceae bacterium]|nr:hypothetical protein [Spirochaetia bacterium]MCF7952012.1 hypothetical protein [Spirochaetaceae bacterium]